MPVAAATVDPFVFVAAVRYAILRPLTSASATVAEQIRAHADVIRQDAGCSAAIVQAIDESLPRLAEPAGMGQSEQERQQLVALWEQARQALAR